MKNSAKSNVKTMVTMAFLLALVVVLQALASTIKIGMFSLSFVLIPVVIGAILYGPKAGAVLGAAFGVVVTIQSVTGMDQGGFAMFSVSPILTVVVCMLKGTAAGYVAGLVYKLLKKKNLLATIIASITCPIINTGIFLLLLCTCYRDVLSQWAQGAGGVSSAYYVFVFIVVANFLPEILLNGLLSPAVVRIVHNRNK